MKRIVIIAAPSTEYEVFKITDVHAKPDFLYLVPDDGTSLEDYAAPYKKRIAELEAERNYLVRAKNWIIRNLRA